MNFFILELFKGEFYIGMRYENGYPFILNITEQPFKSDKEALDYVVKTFDTDPKRPQLLRTKTHIFYKKTDNPIEKLEVMQKIDAYFKDFNREHITPDFDVFDD